MILLLALACTGAPDSGDSTGPTCTRGLTWQDFADGFFASYCRSCHSATAADRHDAPVGVNFDTEDEVRAQVGAIQASIDAASMPPGGGLTDDDVTLIREWLTCGDEAVR